MVGEPGIPSVNIGNIEPVLAALLAASGAHNAFYRAITEFFRLLRDLLGEPVGHQRTRGCTGRRQDTDKIAQK